MSRESVWGKIRKDTIDEHPSHKNVKKASQDSNSVDYIAEMILSEVPPQGFAHKNTIKQRLQQRGYDIDSLYEDAVNLLLRNGKINAEALESGVILPLNPCSSLRFDPTEPFYGLAKKY